MYLFNKNYCLSMTAASFKFQLLALDIFALRRKREREKYEKLKNLSFLSVVEYTKKPLNEDKIKIKITKGESGFHRSLCDNMIFSSSSSLFYSYVESVEREGKSHEILTITIFYSTFSPTSNSSTSATNKQKEFLTKIFTREMSIEFKSS